MPKPKQDELTPIEKKLAERAEAEAAAEEAEQPTAHPPEPGWPDYSSQDQDTPKEFSMFDERWEPPSRPLYDYEVIALVNRDCGRYHASGLMLDSPEDIDAFVDKQLETYKQLTQYQAEYYRMTVCALLFQTTLTALVQKQMQYQRDRGAAHQLIQQATKPSKKRRAS